jgi:hypothetical protein
MNPDRIFSFIIVAAIATSFYFLLSPLEVTANASDNSRTVRINRKLCVCLSSVCVFTISIMMCFYLIV